MTGGKSAPSSFRLEDEKFLRGQGRFVADIAPENVSYAVFLRSPRAHAKITRIDADKAKRLPGVLGLYLGSDIRKDGLGGVPWEVRPPGARFQQAALGSPEAASDQPLIASDVVRFAGEIVAMVVADSQHGAIDAAEAINIEYEDLPVQVDPSARKGSSIWPDFPDNECFSFEMGDSHAVEQAMAAAHVRVEYACRNQRISAAPMEPRAYIGYFDPVQDAYLLQASAGKPHFARNTMASHVFRIDRERISVETPDVGGGFGAKNILYPEECLVIWAARKVARPVKWVSTRAESLQVDLAGRDQHCLGEMAFDAQGKIIAYRATLTSNLGAYLAPRGVVPVRHSANAMSSVYKMPALHVTARGVFTNTTPTCSLRGTGAPEMAYLTERIIDIAAERMQLDPVDLRRRNLLDSSDMPYVTPHGIRYDSGDPKQTADEAIRLADLEGYRDRKERSRQQGKLRGLGVANGIEILNVFYDETAWLEVLPDGNLLCSMGTQSSGQGHATVYADIIAERLKVPRERIRVLQGDTRRILFGNGTGASRSLSSGGSAASIVAMKFAEAVATFLAGKFNYSSDEIQFANGLWTISSTNHAYTFDDVCSIARKDGQLALLSATGVFSPKDGTYPYGCDVCEVEVDPDTGEVQVVSYVAVHDVGKAMNIAIIDGQVHGSTVQGLGQALLEQLEFDNLGQLINGSFMDYAMPTASFCPPAFVTGHVEIPSPANPLGAKGVGESGTTGAPPAVMNAIANALQCSSAHDIQMPATPLKIWQAMRGTGAKRRLESGGDER